MKPVDYSTDLVYEDPRFDGCINLIGALFRLTSQDLQNGSKEAQIFLGSVWFEDICSAFRIPPDKIRAMICSGVIKSRVSYE